MIWFDLFRYFIVVQVSEAHVHELNHLSNLWLFHIIFCYLTLPTDIHFFFCFVWEAGISQSVQWLSYGLEDQGSIPSSGRNFFFATVPTPDLPP
jgi:hypothetical protein